MTWSFYKEQLICLLFKNTSSGLLKAQKGLHEFLAGFPLRKKIKPYVEWQRH